MKSILTLALCLFAGSLQAQTWTQFLGDSPAFPTELAPKHGLAMDGAGRTFVQTMNPQPVIGTQFSHIYALDDQGQHAWMWSLVGRPAGATLFESRGFSAFQGHRVAWYETGTATSTDDVLYLYFPNNANGGELRFPRVNGAAVLHAASDGVGGALIVRKVNGFGRPVMERYASNGTVQWSTPLGLCGAGTTAIAIEDADLRVDPQNPWFSEAYVRGRCTGGIAVPSSSFVQGLDIADGQVWTERQFNPNLSGLARVGTHLIGQGAWLYDYIDQGGMRQLMVADAQHGFYLVNWPSDSGPVAIDLLEEGGLIKATLPSAKTGYTVARIHRTSGSFVEIDEQFVYPTLAGLANRPLIWSADQHGARIVVFRSAPASSAGSVTIMKILSTGKVEWERTIKNVTANAQPQLRLDPISNEFVLAVNRQLFNETIGVHVERFGAAEQYWCLDTEACGMLPWPTE